MGSFTKEHLIYQNTKKCMIEYASKLEAGTQRAQCYSIANLRLKHNETIAEALLNDHASADGCLRAALLMCEAGCAKHNTKKEGYFGEFIFDDDSILNKQDN